MLDNLAPDFGCPDEDLVVLNIFYGFYLVIGFDQKKKYPYQYVSVFIHVVLEVLQIINI